MTRIHCLLAAALFAVVPVSAQYSIIGKPGAATAARAWMVPYNKPVSADLLKGLQNFLNTDVGGGLMIQKPSLRIIMGLEPWSQAHLGIVGLMGLPADFETRLHAALESSKTEALWAEAETLASSYDGSKAEETIAEIARSRADEIAAAVREGEMGVVELSLAASELKPLQFNPSAARKVKAVVRMARAARSEQVMDPAKRMAAVLLQEKSAQEISVMERKNEDGWADADNKGSAKVWLGLRRARVLGTKFDKAEEAFEGLESGRIETRGVSRLSFIPSPQGSKPRKEPFEIKNIISSPLAGMANLFFLGVSLVAVKTALPLVGAAALAAAMLAVTAMGLGTRNGIANIPQLLQIAAFFASVSLLGLSPGLIAALAATSILWAGVAALSYRFSRPVLGFAANWALTWGVSIALTGSPAGFTLFGALAAGVMIASAIKAGLGGIRSK